ncbi:MAG: hypothetical protein JXR48_00360 [Candidatus Delongbacteria bacterium]|nr:hypothetical protein [Candidatus Delongbacteria bacterium]MBN2833396.1 hypothetical protein [Candidatus Delongbacteria bacterium]
MISNIRIILFLSLFFVSCMTPVGVKKSERHDIPENLQKKPVVEEIAISNKTIEDKSPIKSESIDNYNSNDIEKSMINSLKIAAKANGTLLQFKVDGEISEDHIAISLQDNGNVNITFYKAEFYSGFEMNMDIPSFVKGIERFDFDQSVQLTISFPNKFSGKELVCSGSTIMISLFN